MAERSRSPRIYVLAGTNGAGKSSIAGAAFRRGGTDYYNPDEAARRLRSANPNHTDEEVNAAAWQIGTERLRRAIADKRDFNFETTLGGTTMTSLLAAAALDGFDIRVWYAGLTSPELHIERVRARVAKGGHDIPDDLIRKRYDSGRENLIRLLPLLTELRLYDNSADADPARGREPRPILLLHYRDGAIVRTVDLAAVPQWAKPIVAAAINVDNGST